MKHRSTRPALRRRPVTAEPTETYPVHSDGFQVLEDEVPGRFGAVSPFRLHKLEQGVSGYILRHRGDPGGPNTHSHLLIASLLVLRGILMNTYYKHNVLMYYTNVLPDIRHQGVPVEFRLGVVGRWRWIQGVIIVCRYTKMMKVKPGKYSTIKQREERPTSSFVALVSMYIIQPARRGS